MAGAACDFGLQAAKKVGPGDLQTLDPLDICEQNQDNLDQCGSVSLAEG